jgi:hypothetical protein
MASSSTAWRKFSMGLEENIATRLPILVEFGQWEKRVNIVGADQRIAKSEYN